MARGARRHALVPRGEVSFGLQEHLTNLNPAIARRIMQRSRTIAESGNYNVQNRKNIQYAFSKMCWGGSLTSSLNSRQLSTARAARKLERGFRVRLLGGEASEKIHQKYNAEEYGHR